MGPVGQIVKFLFCMILAMELAFSVAIYAMSTILLCSSLYIPENILLHGSLALFLSIVTLSVIHRGFHAVAHDCPYHLYCFAVILVALLLIQFLFEMFGIRATSGNVWYQQHSLPIHEALGRKLDLDDNIENISEGNSDKMAYRVPTAEELQHRKKQLYGEPHDRFKNHRSRWNNENKTNHDNNLESHQTKPHRKKIGRRRECEENDEKCKKDRVFRGGREGDTEKPPDTEKTTVSGKPSDAEKPTSTEKSTTDNKSDQKMTGIPMVLVFHGYSFILKMVCVALSVLTGFMYQLEYI